MKQITLHGQVLGQPGQPLICVPLVGTTHAAVLAELADVLPKKPDILEWRVDFFTGIGDVAAVVELAVAIRQAAGGIPLLFTRRSVTEGGERIALDEAGVMALYAEVCARRCVDIIDYELSHPEDHLLQLRQVSRANDVAMIMSYHDFQSTPEASVLTGKFMAAARLGADIGKVAVMPRNPGDVLTLLAATWQASESLDMPLISMSMGGLGALSRLFGSVFGSAVSFAVGKSCSAPGQIAIEDLRSVLALSSRFPKGQGDA